MGASVDGTRLRKDSAPVTTALWRFVGGRVPFTPGLLSSAVIARLCRLSSFLSTFHVRGERAERLADVLRMEPSPSLNEFKL